MEKNRGRPPNPSQTMFRAEAREGPCTQSDILPEAYAPRGRPISCPATMPLDGFQEWPPGNDVLRPDDGACEKPVDSVDLIRRANKLSSLSKCLGKNVFREQTLNQETCQYQAGTGEV